MQVEFATEEPSAGLRNWRSFFKVSRWFAVITIIMVLLTLVFYLAIVIAMMVHDFSSAKKMEYRKRVPKHRHTVSEMKSGVE